ncbi:MAG: alpha-N-acetylglucosaminidase C-terminal domain-containing protein, partial [Bacteroidaceae bacterium]|nr:alpha-N-acetylglucosaminidase C-terminal domain-containing protein [Bacteroidaceae bacterium]
LSAITTGLGWYLNNVAHINIAWNSLNEKTATGGAYVDLSSINLPLPAEETHSSDAKYRYYLNYCTFGYSMTSWTWTRWQQEIDWMALHGINMPLQLVGMEEVWRKFLTMEEGGKRKYGYTDEEAKAFVAGPAFIAWWAMNNLQGWGGTATGSKSGYNNLPGAGGVQDDAWYDRQKKLAKQILDAQRALGMQPVLPGWSGMVPTNFASKSTYATRYNGENWAGDFVRPLLLNTSVGEEKYAEIAADYYACLEEVMGESQYYSMDPFHEGGGAGTMEDYEAIYAAMETAKPGSQWVIQQWQWSDTQEYSLSAVPAGRLVVLDLFSDGSPAFDGYKGYAPQDAVFCAIPNFGGRSGLMGRLQNVTDNYFKFKGKYASIKGIGTAPEAIEQTPVTYDLIYQLPWMNGQKPDVAAWVDNYAVARYGKDNAVVKEAWSLLRQGPLNYGADGIQGPVEDVWAARPNLDANKASSWGKTLANAGHVYTPARRQMLIDAVYKLIDQEDELELANGSVYKSNYLYDLVEFGGGVMADYAYDLLLGIKAAKNAEGTSGATYIARRDAFLQLILDMDAFRGTNLNFRLGKWTQEARDAAGEVEGATTATPDWYEYNNARTILTTWSSPGTNLTDYSYRSWQGLLKDYYYKRWKYYFDNNCTNGEYKYFEWNWAHGMTHNVGDASISTTPLTVGQDGHTASYTRDAVGNTIEEANKMLGKYIIPVAMADGTHYAYRYLTNDLSSKVTIIASGNCIDLTQYFGTLEGATVTGDFIEGGSSTNFTEIPLKKNLADGVYTGTITLADGTVLTFGVTVNPKYYGAYQIKFDGNPVFIQYNVGGDNGGSVGYKVMGAKGFGETGNEVATGITADYEADKIFTITPSGVGFTLSAQGQYLKTTASSGWAHIMFSEQKGDAGIYKINEASEFVTFKSTNTSGHASVAIFGNGAWGNDVDSKAKSFTLTKVENYAITIPASGYYGICLPFNVVLPTGVTAYDVTVQSLTCGEDGAITSLTEIATEGQILKAGTPALLKGTAGGYNLAITMDNTDAKTSSLESKLRGNFVKQTLAPGTLNKFIYTNEGAHPFVRVNGEQEIPANTCWIEANIDADNVEVTEYQGKVLKIDNWLFTYEVSENGSITLLDAAVPGDGKLEIGSYYTVNGQTQRVSAISPTFLHNNKQLTSITLPATMTNLGFQIIEPMFEGSYEGQPGDGINNEGNQGKNACFVFPNDPVTSKPYEVSGTFAWRLTLDVTIDNPDVDFNNFGSSIVSTLENSLADYYTKAMQIYLHKGHKNIVVKIDNNDDRYLYKTKVLDAEGNETDKDLVMTNFKFQLEHDGAGGYQVVIYYENGKAKMYNISAAQNSTLPKFDRLYYSLPEGIHVKVKFEKLMSKGLFVGCTNLHEIIVDPANPTFKSCDHGVLYDKNGYYVMRIPEGETSHHFDIPSKVVKLYPGAVHGVNADIVLHSNPQIGVVEGHENDVKEAKFYLSLDDKDGTITENETGYGGARDFTSANNNTYLKARYKRAPLKNAEVFGTICLPFVPENATAKYDFFEITSSNASSLTFTQVTELKANEPYIYRMKATPEEASELSGDEVFGTDESGNDIFETNTSFTVETKAKYDPTQHKAGKCEALGSFVNYYVETEKHKKSNFYLYTSSDKMFHRITKKLTYRPYRAFFVVTPEEGQAAQAPSLLNLVLLDGTTTSIDATLVEGMEAPVYYDLSGRRVLNPVSGGIYIVNGQKVVIK